MLNILLHMVSEHNKSNARIALLAFAIAVVALLFIIYGINTFYKQPDMNTLCGTVEYRVIVESCPENDVDCFCDTKENRCEKTNPVYLECMNNYENARENYNLTIFIIMSILGALMVIGSFFIPNNTVSFGIMGGGILSILVGVLRNWSNVQDWMRFLLLGIILVALVWIGYNKMKD
jgi:hypothetical protein